MDQLENKPKVHILLLNVTFNLPVTVILKQWLEQLSRIDDKSTSSDARLEETPLASAFWIPTITRSSDLP